MTKIKDVAQTIRSKNSSPYEITIDIIFDDVTIYKMVKQSKMPLPEKVTEHYGSGKEYIKDVFYYDEAHAIKIAIQRPITAGDSGDTDVYGAQQYAPILNMEVE